jgi:hypothetical protein
MIDRSAGAGEAFSVASASRFGSLVIKAALRTFVSWRFAAFSLRRSKRRSSFWRFLKVSMVVSSPEEPRKTDAMSTAPLKERRFLPLLNDAYSRPLRFADPTLQALAVLDGRPLT